MHIYQKHKYGCGVACLAMFTNLSYNTIKNKFYANHNLDKYGITNMEHILLQLGFKVKLSKKIPQTRAILTVESINKKNAWHSVYWNGKELFDPQISGEVYTTEKLLTNQKELFLSAIYSKQTK